MMLVTEEAALDAPVFCITVPLGQWLLGSLYPVYTLCILPFPHCFFSLKNTTKLIRL